MDAPPCWPPSDGSGPVLLELSPRMMSPLPTPSRLSCRPIPNGGPNSSFSAVPLKLTSTERSWTEHLTQVTFRNQLLLTGLDNGQKWTMPRRRVWRYRNWRMDALLWLELPVFLPITLFPEPALFLQDFKLFLPTRIESNLDDFWPLIFVWELFETKQYTLIRCYYDDVWSFCSHS